MLNHYCRFDAEGWRNSLFAALRAASVRACCAHMHPPVSESMPYSLITPSYDRLAFASCAARHTLGAALADGVSRTLSSSARAWLRLSVLELCFRYSLRSLAPAFYGLAFSWMSAVQFHVILVLTTHAMVPHILLTLVHGPQDRGAGAPFYGVKRGRPSPIPGDGM